MKDFTLPRRDLEIKLRKYGLLAVMLIRPVLFKASFSPRSGHIVEIGYHSIVLIVTQVRYPRKISSSPAEIWR